MTDVLARLSPPDLAAFYGRLADGVDKGRGALKVSLAALLMRHWLENRDATKVFEFEAPEHLQTHDDVLDTLAFHRRVLLTQTQGRFDNGVTRWVGVVPRLVGKAPFPKWDTKFPLQMTYESLVEMPLRYQLTGDDRDRDLLYSLRGFQLKSIVTLTAKPIAGKRTLQILFQSYQAQVRDTYDWNYKEHLTVPNPDWGSKAPGAVEPQSKHVVVYHTNAERLERARLAAPYDLRTIPWTVKTASITASAEVDPVLPK